MSINMAVVAGNMTRDIEVRTTNSGFSIGEFTLAVNDRRKENGSWVDYPNFIDVKLLGTRAEKLAPYLTKGTKLAVQGKLQQERWEKDGQKRSKLLILADEVEMLSKGESGAAKPQNGSQSLSEAYTGQVVGNSFPGAKVSGYSDSDIPF